MAVVTLMPAQCLALPDVFAVKAVNVTTDSMCVAWLTDTPSEPGLEVYSDGGMANEITSQLEIEPFAGVSSGIAQAAMSKGVMMARVRGLEPDTAYYVRAVTADASDLDSRSFSTLMEVTTETEAASYVKAADGEPRMIVNDLVAFPVYVLPGTSGEDLGPGSLILLVTPGARYPISAFVGEGVLSPEGVVDLNNLFGPGGINIPVEGMERAQIDVYRGGSMLNLEHYRWIGESSGQTEVNDALRGFFADFDLDGKIDSADFEMFKKYYRTAKSDAAYNPDYDYVDDPEGVVDVREFSSFAEQYGRDGVPAQ